MLFWNSLAFSMIQQMLAIWSLIPLPSLNPTWTSGSSWVAYNLSLTSPTWRGFQFQKNSSKIFLCVSIDGEIGSCPKAALDCFSLVSYPPSLPYLTTAWICPLETREGHGGWMKAVSCNGKNGGHRKTLCPGAPQSPVQSPLHSYLQPWHGGIYTDWTNEGKQKCFLEDISI